MIYVIVPNIMLILLLERGKDWVFLLSKIKVGPTQHYNNSMNTLRADKSVILKGAE